MKAVAAALVLAAMASSCFESGDYRCHEHDQCGDGFCEIDGRCSQSDRACPSGRRYRAREGARSNTCVGQPCADNALVALAAGGDHACALRTGGGVSCWGRNDDGQLGDGTRTPRSRDVPVMGLTGATAVAAGLRHTCAVVETGEVFCWGADDAGQLGDGGGPARATPVAVPGVTGAASVAAGAAFSCALLRDGTARCWGDNTLGQLGDGGAAAARRAPTPVFALAGLRALSAHGQHACAVRDDETLWCWGDNSQGQIGDGTFSPAPQPVRVQPLSAVTDVAAGLLHTCAATRAEGLFCWGNNNAGQLGREPGGPLPRPTAVPIVTNPVAVTAGAQHTCAIRQGGATLCWGANADGQLGEGSTGALPFPVPVTGLGASAGVVAGGSFTCARGAGGDVFCWGDDHYGQLGLGRAAFRTRAAPAVEVMETSDLAAGAAHTCVVHGAATKARAACWGANQAGQLGDGTTIDRSLATPVKGELDAVSVAAGLAHSCALAEGGSLWCWGRGSAGQLGPARTVDTALPTMVPLPAGWSPTHVAAGDEFTCAALADGKAACWGANDDGQLGDGTTTARAAPSLVAGAGGTGQVLGVEELAAGADHACVRLADGGVRCWGRGTDGQLGDGFGKTSASPVSVAFGTTAAAPEGGRALATGATHACVLGQDDGVWCWGGADGPLPVRVKEIEKARGVAAGGAHTCAITEARGVACWGANENGQLGDGDTKASAAPVSVTGLTDAVQLAAGASYTCARRGAGDVWCWGANFAGQLGDGSPLVRTTPQLARLSCR